MDVRVGGIGCADRGGLDLMVDTEGDTSVCVCIYKYIIIIYACIVFQ